MNYHRDKYGNEIKYTRYVYHDDGTRLEVFGTGLNIPGDGGSLCCWRPDGDPRKSEMPICWVDTRKLSVRSPTLLKLAKALGLAHRHEESMKRIEVDRASWVGR